jgi:endonuclease/exonuclease/phosphatase family metal-dependent hydrolase
MRTFRAATLNIWHRSAPWEERLVAIREGMKTVKPDVIGLQEVLVYEGFDQARLIADGLGYETAWAESSPNHGYPVGNAILSRWPILSSTSILLPTGGSDETRILLYALIDAPFGKLPFFTTHLNWKLHHGHIRQLQVRAVADAIAKIAPEGSFPPVVVGDFNAAPDADEIRFMKGLTALGGECVYYADAFDLAGDGTLGATFSKTNPFAEPLREPERRIDYVFVRGPDDSQRGEPIECQVCFNRSHAGTFPSDPFGVVATITAGR